VKIFFVKSAEKELLKLDKNLAKRILDKIGQLRYSPFGQNSQKLGGGKGYRVRIGDYRVVYTVDKTAKEITIVRVSHRRDVYR
jgi:mRNA interferase RelE/StbE